MSTQTKRAMGKVLLRGPALSAWTRRQFARQDRAYLRAAVNCSRGPLPDPIRPRVLLRQPVRNILVIADCMWEQNELVPDLRRKWSVALLDLKPALAERSDLPDAVKVSRAIEKFISAAQQSRPDVILVYARASLLSDELFAHLRKFSDAPLLGMNLDDKATFFDYGIFSAANDNYQRWAGHFDLNITNTLASTDWYNEKGFSCIYSPQGVNLPDDLPMLESSAAFKHEFTFVGSHRVDRANVITRLQDMGIRVQVFGAGWPNSQWAESPTTIYRESQINLGIGFSTATQTLTTVKGRDFECAGVGACYLTTYNWELTNHFEMGKEILCYRNVEELVEIFGFYRRRPEACLKIAQAAYRRSRAEHTWRKRFERVFRELGLKT